MKTPLNWISAYTDIETLTKEKGAIGLAHLYSIHTAEIDSIEKYGQEDRVLVGKIVEVRPHPDSDHLNVVKVDLGLSGITQIVCGASNVIDAKFVAVATVGSVLKGDFEIKQAKLRGQESNGMICSEDELDFQEARAPGIMRLEDHFDIDVLEGFVGKPFFDLKTSILGNGSDSYEMPLRDIVFEIDNKFITNRPDLFSIEGNAREFSAIFDLPFRQYDKRYSFTGNDLDVKVSSKKVLAYHLIKMNGVEAGESPFGIRYLLYKSGINPKFDLVDMTNYIMTELGQPMHAFDAAKIEGGIVVRQAERGEKILALNGETYELDENDLVIADDVKVLAIAGVMGGADSAISETTKDIYIESACFEPSSIRLTAQRLGLRSDSSTRYEKSLDPLLTYKALSRALDFLSFLGKGAEVEADFEYIDKAQLKEASLAIDPEFIRKKIGVQIPNAEIERILTALGFTYVDDSGIYDIKVPSWRVTKDISIKEDIAEEIGRIYGYEKVPEMPVIGGQIVYADNRSIGLRQKTQNYFASKGWLEVYNYSFSNESLDEKIGLTKHDDAIRILNAYSNEFTVMRRNMAANLLANVADNKKSSDRFAFFEISKIEWKMDGAFNEIPKIAGISYSIGFDKIKSDLLGFIGTAVPNLEYTIRQGTDSVSYPHLHPNKSGEILLNDGRTIGIFGYINPQVATNFDIEDSKTVYFELDFTMLLELSMDHDHQFVDIPKYPGTIRELNFVMDEKTPAGDIVQRISGIHPFIRNVNVIDTYRSEERIGKGRKSVTFSISLLDLEKTITDDDALEIQNLIIDKISAGGIELRK